MTTYESDLAISKNYGEHDTPKGVVLASKATYTVPAGGLSADDLVKMNPIPNGATVLDVIVQGSAGTATMTIDVGDGTTADKFIDGQDASAAFLARLSKAGGCGVTYSAAGWIYIKFLTAGPTATHVYTCTVLYRM